MANLGLEGFAGHIPSHILHDRHCSFQNTIPMSLCRADTIAPFAMQSVVQEEVAVAVVHAL
eukprot:12423403-Karenia_brevis.AAC.1